MNDVLFHHPAGEVTDIHIVLPQGARQASGYAVHKERESFGIIGGHMAMSILFPLQKLTFEAPWKDFHFGPLPAPPRPVGTDRSRKMMQIAPTDAPKS